MLVVMSVMCSVGYLVTSVGDLDYAVMRQATKQILLPDTGL